MPTAAGASWSVGLAWTMRRIPATSVARTTWSAWMLGGEPRLDVDARRIALVGAEAVTVQEISLGGATGALAVAREAAAVELAGERVQGSRPSGDARRSACRCRPPPERSLRPRFAGRRAGGAAATPDRRRASGGARRSGRGSPGAASRARALRRLAAARPARPAQSISRKTCPLAARPARGDLVPRVSNSGSRTRTRSSASSLHSTSSQRGSGTFAGGSRSPVHPQGSRRTPGTSPSRSNATQTAPTCRNVARASA